MRGFDRDLIRGGHYGQRPLCAALTGRTHGCTDQPANVKKTLANSEPSTHGTKQTCRPARSMSAYWGKADSRWTVLECLLMSQTGHGRAAFAAMPAPDLLYSMGDISRLPALATDLVNNRVDAIVAAAPPAVQAAAGATTSIPVIAIDLESDPVASGLVRSLA